MKKKLISTIIAGVLTFGAVSGFAAGEITVSNSSVESNTVSHTLTVPEAGTLITVVYNSDNDVVKTEFEEVTAGEKTKTITLESAVEKGKTRFMLWNNFDDIRPLTAVAEGKWQTPQVVKVMALGDSITDGFTKDPVGGYRNTLTGKIQEYGISAYVDFVGSGNAGSGYDNDHEGHSGWAIEAISSADDVEKKGRKGLATNMTSWMNTYKPEVILLMIGTNDILSQYKLDEAQTRLQSLANQINNGLSAGGKVYIAKIPYISQTAGYNKTGKDQATLNAQVDAFNEAVVAVAQQNGYEVVDVNGTLTFADLKDGIHPNSGGYEKLGNLWYETIIEELNTRIFG